MRFYTLPPYSEPWPFIIFNANKPENGFRYLKRWVKRIQSVIIDSGIEIFRNPDIKDYPRRHTHRLVRLWKRAKLLLPKSAEVFVTCPDYCDDYNPRQLWISQSITNIERTVQSVCSCLDAYPEVQWLIPIQGHNEKPDSIFRSISLYHQLGITSSHDFFAIANLCTSKRINTIIATCRAARLLLPDKRLHAFGISLPAARKLKGILDSWDSLAYTFPRTPNNPSCKTAEQRKEYFKQFIQRIP